MSHTKIRSPLDLWEKCERKLIVYVMEGISLVTKHGAGNPYVKLIYDKQKQKTQILKHSEDARWREIFYFEITDDSLPLMLEVWTKSGMSEKMIGTCNVGVIHEFDPEVLHDRVFDLELPSSVKAKDKEALDGRIGNVHLRLYYSTERETPSIPPPNQCSNFYYREHASKFQTGDLILYSGVGCIDSLSKVYSGTKYSRVGLVVRLPNKWTGKEKLYVFEITRNIGRELDAFKEIALAGASFYRLFEHLHAVSATEIWWVPLVVPLDKAAAENMIDYLKECVSRRANVDLPPPPTEMIDFFDRFELSLLKSNATIAEICSAAVAIAALRLGGKRFTFENTFVPCVHMMTKEHFGNPVLLRERNGTPMPGVHATNFNSHDKSNPHVPLAKRDAYQRYSMASDDIGNARDNQSNMSSGSVNLGSSNPKLIPNRSPSNPQVFDIPRSDSNPPQVVLPIVNNDSNPPTPRKDSNPTPSTTGFAQHHIDHTPPSHEVHNEPPAYQHPPLQYQHPPLQHQPPPPAYQPPPYYQSHPPAPSQIGLPYCEPNNHSQATEPEPTIEAPVLSQPPQTAPKPKKKKVPKAKKTRAQTATPSALSTNDEEMTQKSPRSGRSESVNARLPAPTGKNLAAAVAEAENEQEAMPSNPSPPPPSTSNDSEAPKSNGSEPPAPPPKTKKKKLVKKVRASRQISPEEADKISENLDEKTKTEIQRRRGASMRVVPDTPLAADIQNLHKRILAPPSLVPVAEIETDISKIVIDPKLVASPVEKQPEEASATPTTATKAAEPTEPTIVVPSDDHQETKVDQTTEPEEPATSEPEFTPKKALVLWRFDAEYDYEISVQEGAIVDVVRTAGDWAVINVNGVEGAVPLSFISLM